MAESMSDTMIEKALGDIQLSDTQEPLAPMDVKLIDAKEPRSPMQMTPNVRNRLSVGGCSVSSDAATATPKGGFSVSSDAASATPPSSSLSRTAGSDRSTLTLDVEERLTAAILSAQQGQTDEALNLLRGEFRAPSPRLGAARHSVLEALISQDRLQSAYDFMLEVLSQPTLPQRNLSMLQEIPEATALPQSTHAVLPQSVELLLRSLTHAQHGRAAELLRALCAAGVALPGDAVLNSVVDAAVRARAYGEAWDVLEILLSRKRRADKYFVSILTKSLESATDRRSVRRGIALVDRFIDQQKDDVDEIVFNSLLNVLGQIGDMLKLQQTLGKMREYAVSPSAVTYGTVVKAYGRARDIDAVLKVWTEMKSRCLGVNPVTCGCVLDACVKCGHLDKAIAIFQEMRYQGLHKNTVLYATLIKGLAKAHDLMGAVHLYQEMRIESVPCNLVTFNSLMDVCVRCGDLQAAAFFLQDMMMLGIDPDLITFSTLIKGYAHTGDVQKALALATELKARGLQCDEIMYNSLIDGCAKAKKLPEGLAVFEEMLLNRVAPSNITFSILVRLHFEAGKIEAAFRLVEDMGSRYRCAPNRVVYTVLLRCCATHGGTSLARGAQLLSDLAAKRNSKMPDQGMVGAIVTGCSQHGDFDTACRVVRDFAGGSARRAGSLVPLDALNTLFQTLGARDDPRGQELLQVLRQKNLSTAHMGVLHGALADGRRNPGGSQADSSSSAALPSAFGACDNYYNNWHAPGSYSPFMQAPYPALPPPCFGGFPGGFPGANPFFGADMYGATDPTASVLAGLGNSGFNAALPQLTSLVAAPGRSSGRSSHGTYVGKENCAPRRANKEAKDAGSNPALAKPKRRPQAQRDSRGPLRPLPTQA